MSDWREQLRRRAIVMEIGGFRPPDDPRASWFGRVSLSLPGESWPTTDGAPMHALCQINLTELPSRPPRLDDLDMVTLFVGPSELPNGDPNGRNWCLRTYRDLSGLAPIAAPSNSSPIRPFPMRPRVVEADFPCWEDVDIALPEDVEADYYELTENAPGLKLGGWPTLIQAEIFWAPLNRHPADPEYVLQIDSCAKAHWSWGHDGVAYIGRGRAPGHLDEWCIAWQCL